MLPHFVVLSVVPGPVFFAASETVFNQFIFLFLTENYHLRQMLLETAFILLNFGLLCLI